MLDRYVAATGQGDGVRARLLGARRAAQHAHPRRLHPALEARRQAALPALPAAHVGPARARSRAARIWSRSRDWFDANIPPEHRARAVDSSRRDPGAPRACACAPKSRPRCPHTAMVMAAGLGKRMRPLTATRPKPLIEVAGKALIDHVLDRLRAAGVQKAVVNVHYLADALEAHLASRDHGLEIVISDEREQLLETGGGLVRAAPLIDCDPFLALNSDNLWIDGPVDTLRLLASQWDDARMDALLLLVPLARASTTRASAISTWTAAGALRRREQSHVAPFVFTGIQMVSKRLLRRRARKALSRPILLWDRAIAEGRCFGAVHQGLWFDVGTPQSIRLTETALETCLRGRGRSDGLHHPTHRSFADALAAGLIQRFGKDPLGLPEGRILLAQQPRRARRHRGLRSRQRRRLAAAAADPGRRSRARRADRRGARADRRWRGDSAGDRSARPAVRAGRRVAQGWRRQRRGACGSRRTLPGPSMRFWSRRSSRARSHERLRTRPISPRTGRCRSIGCGRSSTFGHSASPSLARST